MIEFKVTFLLAFVNNPQNEEYRKAQDTNENVKKNTKKATKISKKNISGKASKANKMQLNHDTNPNVIDAGYLIGSAHIDIKLLPNVATQSIDVVCHERIAKIFVESDSKTIKVFAKDNHVWAPVYLTIKYDHITDPEELISVAHNYIAQCNLSINRGKLSNVAKNNKVKVYYCSENIPPRCSIFEEVFEKDPTISNTDAVKQKIRDKSNEDPLHYEFLTKILNKSGVRYHQFILFPSAPLTPEDELLSDEEFGQMLRRYDSMEYKPFSGNKKGKKGATKGSKRTPNTINKSKKHGVSKKAKDSKAKKNKSENPFKISGESYFTNPNICIYKINPKEGCVKNLFLIVSVNNLMTLEQKRYLKPLVINVKKIMHIPYNFLLKHGFESIFMRYSIPQFKYSCSTLPKRIEGYSGETEMPIDEAHVCFIKDLEIGKVQEFFQTRELRMEIIGLRDKQLLKTISPCLFGNGRRDKNISDISTVSDYIYFLEHPIQPIEEVIAVCCFDLNFPTQFLHEITTAYCHHPENRLVQTYEKAYKVSPFNFPANKNEINLNYKMFKRNKTNPVTESLLISSGTCVKIEWFLLEQLDLLPQILAKNEMYRRGIFFIKDRPLAVSTLGRIMMHNEDVLTPTVYLPNYLQTLTQDVLKPNGMEYLSPHAKAEALTGFVVDNFDTFLFFLETRSSFIMTIFEDLGSYTDLVCHLFFDTNQVFENCLYKEFLNYGGYYIITMHQPLREILRDQNIYMRGNLPIPCYEALMKLDLLIKCSNVTEVYKKNLLPSSKELLSLQMEYGAAHRWTNFTNDRTSVVNVAEDY